MDDRERLKQLANTLKVLQGIHAKISQALKTLADGAAVYEIPRDEIVAVARKIDADFADFLDADYRKAERIFRELAQVQRDQAELIDSVSETIGQMVVRIEDETDDGPWWRRVSLN